MENCPSCGRGENELHKLGCRSETCPKCKGQLLSCNCIFAVVSRDETSFFDNKMKPYNRVKIGG
jgi:hypothetical protein